MLEILAKDHKKWVSMVVKMGCDKMSAEDLVQDMYLRLYDLIKDYSKIMYNEKEINKFFIYVTLRNMYYSKVKNGNKNKMYSWIDGKDDITEKLDFLEWSDDIDIKRSNDEELKDFMGEFESEISSWHPYDREMFRLYFLKGMSLRDIAKETKIGLNSVNNSVRKYKEILKHKLGDRYINYIKSKDEEK